MGTFRVIPKEVKEQILNRTVHYYNYKRKHTALKMNPVEFKLLCQERNHKAFV